MGKERNEGHKLFNDIGAEKKYAGPCSVLRSHMKLVDGAWRVKFSACDGLTPDEEKDHHRQLKKAKVVYPWIQQSYMSQKHISPMRLEIEGSLFRPNIEILEGFIEFSLMYTMDHNRDLVDFDPLDPNPHNSSTTPRQRYE